MSGGAFSFHSLFSVACREHCIKNLKNFRVPSVTKPKIVTNSLPTAAVLVPLCRVNDCTSLLYTVRSANLKNHSGQISFPGGKTDEGETPIETALRETDEEIGIKQNNIEVWGCGPSFPGRNNEIMITPVIGSIIDFKDEKLRLNADEVAEVFTVSLESLCDPKNQFHTQFKNGYILPVFVANGHKIWGITAYITHVFLTCLLPKEIYRNDWMKKSVKISI